MNNPQESLFRVTGLGLTSRHLNTCRTELAGFEVFNEVLQRVQVFGNVACHRASVFRRFERSQCPHLRGSSGPRRSARH